MDDKLLETTEDNLGSDEDTLQDDVGDDAADRSDDMQEESDEPNYLTQEDFDRVLRRKHAQWERKFARRLGFKSVDEAIPYIQAGQAVSRAAGLPPTEVASRVGAIAQTTAPATVPHSGAGLQGGATPLEQRLDRIEELLEEERTAQVLKSQEAEARKEFGPLFDKHREDIEDKAEEMGLSLTDAAAIVLRPYLRDHIEQQARTKQQLQRRKKVEGSGESPGTGKPDYEAILSPAQREAARKTGVSLERYYQQLKRLGKL